jgi:hypothetical protein
VLGVRVAGGHHRVPAAAARLAVSPGAHENHDRPALRTVQNQVLAVRRHPA